MKIIHLLFLLLASLQLSHGEAAKAPEKTTKALLVTGCGRSGTGFMASFLNTAGYPVGHERMGQKGTVSWLTGAKVPVAPWGPKWINFNFKHVFHQVRNPIKVIQSMYNVPPRAGWDWIGYVLPQIDPDDDTLTKSVKYWIYWNEMVEAEADWTYRIEDLEKLLPELSERLGFHFSNKIFKSIPKDTNTKGPPKVILSWEYLRDNIDPELYLALEGMANHYGYKTWD